MSQHPRDRAAIRARATDHLAVAVGTTMGLFIVSDGVPDGPTLKGCAVPAFLQSGGRFVAAVRDHERRGSVWASDDDGATWSELAGTPPAFPEESGLSLATIWELSSDASAAGSVLWAGVEPAALFRSDDGGTTFRLVPGLFEHPDRKDWQPGSGGLVLHSVITHPDRPGRLIVAVSGGGVYRSDDGGESWQARNAGIAAPFLAEQDPDHGQCVHRLALDAAGPDVLWAQNHAGVYRTEDAGNHWTEVGRAGQDGGLPTDFGFTIVAHPTEPGCAFVFPLESADFACNPAGQPRVYRTEDAGGTWEALGTGLPRRDAHFTVVRGAFAVGGEPPYPLVVGTRTGQVYASADAGERWRLFIDNLPPVLCVEVLA